MKLRIDHFHGEGETKKLCLKLPRLKMCQFITRDAKGTKSGRNGSYVCTIASNRIKIELCVPERGL